MTTKVTINAHCASNKDVIVTIADAEKVIEVNTLRDGESIERVVYDNKEITVKEVIRE